MHGGVTREQGYPIRIQRVHEGVTLEQGNPVLINLKRRSNTLRAR
jgi:hypothetical protein